MFIKLPKIQLKLKPKKVLKPLAIFFLITSWLLTGYPAISIPGFGIFPPKINEAVAATAGPSYASTAVNDAGTGTLAWTTPGNATATDDSKASVALTKNTGISNYIKATGFGFSVPSNARIDGITVEWEKSDNLDGGTGETQDNAVRIVKTDAIGATDLSNVSNWTTTDTFVSYGGTTNLWGDTWTAADINDSTFGAAISAKNVKVSGGGAATTAYVDSVRITITYTLPIMTVGTTGTQTSTMNIGSTNNYVGGAFTFATDINTATVTQVIVTDTGTVNANSNLSNADIYYETAATTCSSETYGGTETLFGTGATFNASEKSTITGSMSVGTTQVCVYVVLDVGSGASGSETIEIEITNPSTEVTISSGTVTPGTAVAISGTTTLQSASATFTQNKYLWYVDNDLADPTAIWGNPDLIENQAIVVVPSGNDPPDTAQELRLRVNYVVNTAGISISEKYFKLEYKAGTDGTCTTGSWTDVGTGDWVYATSGVTDGADIIKVLSDTTTGKGEEYVKGKPSQVNHVAASAAEIIEYDFHIVGTNATANTQYSFRVVETNNLGTTEVVFDGYTSCPTLTTEPGMANLLRHGNVFTEGIEKGFFWN